MSKGLVASHLSGRQTTEISTGGLDFSLDHFQPFAATIEVKRVLE
jgi:hypothetical protein